MHRAACVVNTLSSTVSIIDRRDSPFGTVLPASVPLPSGAGPVSVALTRDGAFAYVTNCKGNSVSIIDTNQARTNPGARLDTITNVGNCPQGIAIIE